MQVSLVINMHSTTSSAFSMGQAEPAEFQNPTKAKNSNCATDLFSLLYVNDAQKDCSTEPPSCWATFDCKTTLFCHFFYFKFARGTYGLVWICFWSNIMSSNAHLGLKLQKFLLQDKFVRSNTIPAVLVETAAFMD